MFDVTLALAILLTCGLFAAKLVQLLGLPSITGFVLAGLALGPSGLALLTSETVGHNLDHFTQIALMLIAFGIGEHIEFRRLGAIAGQVVAICLGQALACFGLVFLSTWAVTWIISPHQPPLFHAILALLLAAVSLAGAPAGILHLVREFDSRGPLTTTLLAVIALGDGLAIAVFGTTLSIIHQFGGQEQLSLLSSVLGLISEIGGSLAIGAATGLIIDFVLHKTHKRGEMLTAGLGFLLLCGEITRLLELSPLLAGMAAGCILINREERDIRLFRILNGFEPPIYVLFFTLAGVHLDLSMLQLAGWAGPTYFIARILGKYCGSRLGALLSAAPQVVRNYLGFGLMPQAGVAIGLVFIISSDQRLQPWSENLSAIVLAGVVLSELIGPIMAKKGLFLAREVPGHLSSQGQGAPLRQHLFARSDELCLAPWHGEPISPATHPQGVVIFGAANYATVRGLARVTTILAHYFDALPMSVRVINETTPEHPGRKQANQTLFLPEIDEVKSLGYPLLTATLQGSAVEGILQAVEQHRAKALVLGYPLGHNPLAIQKIVDKVARRVSCPLVVVRFIGTFNCEQILVPVLEPAELSTLQPVLEAMGTAGQPTITLMQLLDADCGRRDIRRAEAGLQRWLETNLLECVTQVQAIPAGSRLEAILDEARHHDLVIIQAVNLHGLQRLFLGSLAAAVVTNCRTPVVTVYPGKSN